MLVVVVKTVEVEVIAAGVLVDLEVTVTVFVHGVHLVLQLVLTFEVDLAQREV